MGMLAGEHDCLLLDLDGTLFRGHAPTDGAVETLENLPTRALFVTNNATRSADAVAAHLRELGFTATADDVVTSAQSAARMLAGRIPSGSKVLVVGTEALVAETVAVGLQPVRAFADDPVAVIQGLSMTIGWPELAEATLAIRAGALWVASNLDATLPTERGLVPGNGSLVAALQAATGSQPLVAGKPGTAIMQDAVARAGCQRPLVVGDRLDTDIAGANAAKMPSLMVLSGVGTAREAVFAGPAQRPTYLGADLRALRADSERVAITEQPGWRVESSADGITVGVRGVPGTATDDAADDGLAVVRAVARAVWDADAGQPVSVRAVDEHARAALERWSLLVSTGQTGDRLA